MAELDSTLLCPRLTQQHLTPQDSESQQEHQAAQVLRAVPQPQRRSCSGALVEAQVKADLQAASELVRESDPSDSDVGSAVLSSPLSPLKETWSIIRDDERQGEAY